MVFQELEYTFPDKLQKSQSNHSSSIGKRQYIELYFLRVACGAEHS